MISVSISYKDEIKEQKLLWKRNAMNNCYVKAAEAVLDNANSVASLGKIEGPTLMFVSDGKQVSPNWINNECEFAEQVNAEIVYLNCGHYIHYYESEKISRMIKEFSDKITTQENLA